MSKDGLDPHQINPDGDEGNTLGIGVDGDVDVLAGTVPVVPMPAGSGYADVPANVPDGALIIVKAT